MGGEITKTHDLVALGKKCTEYENSFVEIQKILINLTDYGVHVRYPFYIDLEDEDALNATEDAVKIKEFVLRLIN